MQTRTDDTSAASAFLTELHPYDALSAEERSHLATAVRSSTFPAGGTIYGIDEPLDGIWVIRTGRVEIIDRDGEQVSLLGPGNTFGERGFLRDGRGLNTARAVADTELVFVPGTAFRALYDSNPVFRRFFSRATSSAVQPRQRIGTARVGTLMANDPISIAPQTSIQDAARLMREHHISSLCVVEGETLVGLLTTRDMTNRVVAEGRAGAAPVREIMTPAPLSLPATALGTDVLHTMLEHRIGHVPITDGGKLVGIVTQTDITRYQAMTAGALIAEIVDAKDGAEIAGVTAKLPQLLVQLVNGGNAHDVVTRLITDIADAATRRLLALAEAELGPPPVPYLWLACGSQGRQEQAGVSDQDNCLIIHDDMTAEHEPYFEALTTFVCDGLDAAGYFYCPGDMMATNPKWRQPVSVWQKYFSSWIAVPDPMAQMLASVMFDLRAIGGDRDLFDGIHEETLARAQKNSVFVSHMASNALKHTPPLGLFGGIATIRSGELKGEIDLKHSGVQPVVNLARIYALRGRIAPVGTRERLVIAEQEGVISHSGGRDMIGAFDVIADTRLKYQAIDISEGRKADNFIAPTALSDFDRSHLRDAFVVIRTMQSALGSSQGPLG